MNSVVRSSSEVFSLLEKLKRRSRDWNKNQCITEEDFNQLRCRPTSFSTSYESSTLNFDLNRGPVFWSHRRTSEVFFAIDDSYRIFYSRHEAEKRLYAEEAPTIYVAQEGNYQAIELFSKVQKNPSRMVLSHVLILPCCHSKCSYIIIM
ncbi:LOW QUALITY PROTEIN: hypothetical protein V1478_016460 [Vespula squamosa]|uniref:Uncharacterized protein n=1 Tax=Vespula squamosa TaxID=30214 RepID=A0ABD1ZZX8_VESSQ